MTSLSHLSKRVLPLLLLGLMALVPVKDAAAQIGEDLHLYGFFQGQYRYSTEEGGSYDEVSSFSLQQLNAFLMKEFNPEFNAFINAELTNSFASDEGWGSLRLEEAWVRYKHSGKFSAKAGLLVPTFNNLNEIKNRTPLLPYIFRPVAYESSFATIVNIGGYTPTRANIQVSGALPVGRLRFDYAAYLGNNSAGFATKEAVGTLPSGTDLSMNKLYGGRLGMRWRSLKMGVSASHDQVRTEYDIAGILSQSPEAIAQFSQQLGQPLEAITPEMMTAAGLPASLELDEVGRTRIGADLSFDRSGFFGEAEVIRVFHALNDEHQATLDLGGQITNGYIRDDLDMSFYYAMLGYNITEKLFGYGYYYHNKDNADAVQAPGMDAFSFGAGYRPVFGVVIKTQYIHVGSRDNPTLDFTNNSILAAVSVSF